MLALFAALVLAPLLYIPGYLIGVALLGAAQPRDPLERHYERVLAGALLNGWLALMLAELGMFSVWLHLALILLVCIGGTLVGWRRGVLRLPNAPLGIVAPGGWPSSLARIFGRGASDARQKNRPVFVFRSFAPLRTSFSSFVAHWETIGFVAIGLIFALLVARPYEVVLGARDAGVYATTGFAIARSGGIVQHDQLLQQIDQDQHASDPQLRAAAEQAETNFLGIQSEKRFIATRMRYAGYLVNQGDLSQGRVTSQFLHLYPAWIALLASLLGLRGGLLATGLLGLLGLWSVGLLGRRLAGRWVGLLGMLFLALNGVQVWFSRYSTSEACAQFLGFGALYAFAVMQNREQRTENREQRSDNRRQTRDQRLETRDKRLETGDTKSNSRNREDSHVSRLTSHVSRLTSRAWFAGLLAGLAAGQLALTRIDFFVLVAPLLAYLGYIALTKRWTRAHWALAGGLGAMLLHAALHIVFISRAYVLDTLYARLQDQSAIVAQIAYWLWTPALRQQFLEIPRSAPLRAPYRLPLEIALVIVLTAAFVLLRRDGRPQRAFERLLVRYRPALLRLSVSFILLLGAYGYLIRPQILTAQRLAAAPGCVLPGVVRSSQDCLPLQGYIGAPIQPAKHPNTLAYALTGLPELVRGAAIPPRADAEFSPGNPGESEKIGIAQANLVRVGWYLSPLGIILGIIGFALWWRRGLNAASWLFLAASLISTIFFVRLSYGASDLTYIYILRRYMPLTYPAFSLGMAYALVALARQTSRIQNPFDPSTTLRAGLAQGRQELRTKNQPEVIGSRLTLRVPVLGSRSRGWRVIVAIVLTLVLVLFFAVTNRLLYQHVEYAGALDQLETLAHKFNPGDVLLFRGEGRDTPDLVTTPLKFVFGLDTFAIRSGDPGKYAVDLAHYVLHWQTQGRQVYLVLGPNGAVQLPGLRPLRVGPASLRLPEFQQLRDQKPSLPQEFNFDFVIYRLVPSTAVPETPRAIGADDYSAQVRGFYHTEQIDGTTVAWTNGDALVRLEWPRENVPLELRIDLAPGVARPAQLGPAYVCLSFRPEPSFALVDAPFSGEQCFDLQGSAMAGYSYVIDPRAQPAPATGTFLLRIASPTWSPAALDPAQHDPRQLGVQFGGIAVGSRQ